MLQTVSWEITIFSKANLTKDEFQLKEPRMLKRNFWKSMLIILVIYLLKCF